MRRKGNEVCPSFLSQLSHLFSLTHCLSYIVSCLVRTRVSVKCLDFDTRQVAGVGTGPESHGGGVDSFVRVGMGGNIVQEAVSGSEIKLCGVGLIGG